MADIQSVNYPIQLSTDGGTTYRSLVCLENYDIPVERSITETETFCGKSVGLGSLSFNPSGSAVCKNAPDSDEITYKEMVAAEVDGTLVKFKISAPASGTEAGDDFYLAGDCYVTSTTLQFATNELVKFSWTLTGTGTLDVTA
jgi:hypothetical protein